MRRVRLTHADVCAANLQAPGVTWNLLRKVSTERHQISRGKACTRCRTKKLKCDAGAPCKNCAKAKVDCDADVSENLSRDVEPSSPADSMALLKHQSALERPISPKFWGSPPRSPSNLAGLCAPQFNPFYSIFSIYGLQKDFLDRMLSNLPPRLHLVLSHLGARISQELQSEHLSIVPESADIWEGSTICRQIIKRQDTSQLCAHNGAISELAGAHPEEIATRMNVAELPPFTSEYRLLCLHLYLLLAKLRGAKQLTHFQPMFTSFCRQSVHSERPPTVQLYRVTRNFFQNGEINVVCAVQPEEYDAAVRVCPEARIEFVECDLAGRELTGERLAEKEQIRHMVATEEGRAILDRLADSVIDKFELSIPSGNHPAQETTARIVEELPSD